MSESAITQCPHCSTRFRVNDAQLGAANGAVRCGTCLKVFHALQHVVGGAPRAASATAAPTAAAQPASASSPARAGAATQTPRPRNQPPWPHDDLDLDSLNLDEELAKLDALELKQPLSSVEKNPRPAQGLLARRDDERRGKAPRDGDEPLQAARGGERLEPSLGETLAAERHVSFVPLRRAEDPPEFRLSTTEDDAASSSASHNGLNAVDADEPSAEERSAQPGTRDDARGESLEQLRDEPLRLAWKKPARQWPRRLGWLLLILLALIGLAGQYIAYHFDELARQDAYRPWFARFCEEIGCDLPSKVDVKQIKSSNLVVRSHPDFSGALVVDAILYNRASFSQPFPLLELRFADLDGHLIANRRFKPSEYLGGELAGRTEMPPQVPIHVSLDILDPGPRAVNYSLSFHSPE